LTQHAMSTLGFRVSLILAVYISVIVVLGLIQRVLLGVLFDAIASGSWLLTATSIASINSIAAFILALSSHTLFNVIAPTHMTRCSMAPTPDCRLTELTLRFKTLVALSILPILILALLAGSIVRLGLQATPSTLLSSLAYGVYNIYGVLELAGYTIAYTTPIVGGTRAKVTLALLAITMITLGALIETKVILGTS
jgi:hypothetical protein